MMLLAKLLSMVMIQLSILNTVRHLICGTNKKWFFNMNVNYDALDWDRNWLDDFSTAIALQKLFQFSGQVTDAADVKIHGSVFNEK